MFLLPPQMHSFLNQKSTRRSVGMLLRFILLIFTLILLYSAMFQYIMQQEGQVHSWTTGIYWTLTVMSTLGFGDITFGSDMGRIFSIIVLMSGILFFLIILPFMFIEFLYAPWLEAQKKGRTPRSLPEGTQGHVILVNPSPIALNVADNLKNFGAPYVLLCPDSQTTLDMMDRGYNAVTGEHDSASVYRDLQLSHAAMLVALDTDMRNTNIVFTARDLDAGVPIVATARREESVDILQMAGCTHVFQFARLLGEALARRILNDKERCSIISRFEGLIIAEAPVMRTPLVGKSLKECGLRNATGVNVVGLWERGRFTLPTPDTVFTPTMVMVIAGNQDHIKAVNELLGPHGAGRTSGEEPPVIVIGCGRVGLAVARQLRASRRPYKVVDKAPHSDIPAENMVSGDAADLNVLERAGIRNAPAVLITTHDDDTNIYLTLYCRRLCSDAQIISRANLDRNVSILHTAGADLVLSLASMVSSNIINLLSPGKVMMINEGLNIFRSKVGEHLCGRPMRGSGIRKLTNCSVIALHDNAGNIQINPDPNHVFDKGEELILIGDSQSEKAFLARFGA